MTPKAQDQRKSTLDGEDDDEDVLLFEQNGKNENAASKKVQETKMAAAATTTTRLITPTNSAPYVICTSTNEYVNPTIPNDGQKEPTAEEKLSKMNLDLGLSMLVERSKCKLILWCLQFLDKLFLMEYFEVIFFKIWKDFVPLQFKRFLTFAGWAIYKRIHKVLLGKSTGLHKSQSFEYHAFTTLAWWSRFFPVTPQRCDFSLSQLHVCSPHTVKIGGRNSHVEKICCPMDYSGSGIDIPREQAKHATVNGLYIQYNSNKKQQQNNQSTTTSNENKTSKNVIFWIYGGAYIGGDTIGNSAAADWISQKTQMDVFLPQFRLAPKADLFDVLWDIALAYRWLLDNTNKSDLCGRTNNMKDNNATNIYFWGISSGGASVIRLMQLILEQQQNQAIPHYLPDLFGCMPQGAVLFGPYCDYDYKNNDDGSWKHYDRIDLIVTEAVKECGLQHLDAFIPGSNNNFAYSPVNCNMEGLPPLCVVVSEHEVVYDMTMKLANRARKQGVPVTLGVWKYMCHVFTFLWGFIPEGEESMEFACRWLNSQQEQQKQPKLLPIEEEEQ